jgi:hypothetical protein
MCLIYILVLNGLPESGKDTFASFVANRFKGKVVMHSTVDTVKLMALEWFGVEFDVDKNEKKRRLWSDMKDAWTRYCDGPLEEIKGLVDRLRNTNGPEPVLLITHIREPSEIDKIKSVYGIKCLTVMVQRESSMAVQSNHADRNVCGYIYDVTINNDGDMDQLDRMAERFISLLGFTGYLESGLKGLCKWQSAPTD